MTEHMHGSSSKFPYLGLRAATSRWLGRLGWRCQGRLGWLCQGKVGWLATRGPFHCQLTWPRTRWRFHWWHVTALGQTHILPKMGAIKNTLKFGHCLNLRNILPLVRFAGDFSDGLGHCDRHIFLSFEYNSTIWGLLILLIQSFKGSWFSFDFTQTGNLISSVPILNVPIPTLTIAHCPSMVYTLVTLILLLTRELFT